MVVFHLRMARGVGVAHLIPTLTSRRKRPTALFCGEKKGIEHGEIVMVRGAGLSFPPTALAVLSSGYLHRHQCTNGSTIVNTFTSPDNLELFNLPTVFEV